MQGTYLENGTWMYSFVVVFFACREHNEYSARLYGG